MGLDLKGKSNTSLGIITEAFILVGLSTTDTERVFWCRLLCINSNDHDILFCSQNGGLGDALTIANVKGGHVLLDLCWGHSDCFV